MAMVHILFMFQAEMCSVITVIRFMKCEISIKLMIKELLKK